MLANPEGRLANLCLYVGASEIRMLITHIELLLSIEGRQKDSRKEREIGLD